MQTLLDFIDFNKFKASMIEFKKVMDKDGTKNEVENALELNADNVSTKVYDDLDAESLELNNPKGWLKKTDMDDKKLEVTCSIYARPMEGSKLQLIRMDACFKGGLNMDHLSLYMKDLVLNMKTDPNMIEVKILKFSENPAFGTDYPEVMWFVMKMSGMAARSAVMEFNRTDQPDGSQYLIQKSIEHPDYPDDGKYIRMDAFSAAKAFPIEGGFAYREYSSYNMKGWFPPRLLNMLIGASATAQIKEMQKSLQKYKGK